MVQRMARRRGLTGCFLAGAALATSGGVRPSDTGPYECPDPGDLFTPGGPPNDGSPFTCGRTSGCVKDTKAVEQGDGSFWRAPALCTTDSKRRRSGRDAHRRRRHGRRELVTSIAVDPGRAVRTGAAADTVATVAAILAVCEALSPNVRRGSSSSSIAPKASLILAEMGEDVGLKDAVDGDSWADLTYNIERPMEFGGAVSWCCVLGRKIWSDSVGATACWPENPPDGYLGCGCVREEFGTC